MVYIRHDANNDVASPQPGFTTVTDLGGTTGFSSVTYENFNDDFCPLC